MANSHSYELSQSIRNKRNNRNDRIYRIDQYQYSQNGQQQQCTCCRQSSSTATNTSSHTYSHTGGKPFVYAEPGCGRKFSVQSNMKRLLRKIGMMMK
ncbi:3004_t:CDS:2 [Diversispora eburnea]|uniref:3004_t:CDS:1 n=1 Tax=Diversispora eburnea TaxID=1213867 RepID=A0A9N8YUY0_9GLOM|nr:3004_t:CDS:2 [Diversispora eburnea]